MANYRLKNWFFAITKTLSKRGTRFRDGDKPTQATFEDLLHSVVAKSESADRAKADTGAFSEANNGHVTLATDTQAKANEAQKADRSLVTQPHQLPTVEVINQTTDGSSFSLPAAALSIIPLAGTATRNQYQAKLDETWYAALIAALPPAIDVTGKAALYVNGTEGDDATGDGSINKPFATLSKAKDMVQNGQTIVVYAATYTNTVNMVKAGTSETDKFIYTILFNPGTIINQSVNPFIDNSATTGVVHVFGKPDIFFSNAAAPIVVHSKRTGSGSTGGTEIVTYLDLKTVRNDGTGGPSMVIGGTQLATLQINVASLSSSDADFTVNIDGTQCIPILKFANIGSGRTSGVVDIIRVTSAYAVYIENTRIATSLISTAEVNGIRILANPTNGITISNCVTYLSGSSGTVRAINISGAGDIHLKSLVCDSLFVGPDLDVSFHGTANSDKIAVSNVRSNKPASDNADPALSTIISAFGGVNGLIYDAGVGAGNFFTAKPFDF